LGNITGIRLGVDTKTGLENLDERHHNLPHRKQDRIEDKIYADLLFDIRLFANNTRLQLGN
jgi:hypothetical protein